MASASAGWPQPEPASTPAAAPRLQGVDAIRVLAIVAVITLHLVPFESAAAPVGSRLDAATAITALARFAVPFFFVISGYFWAGKAGQGVRVWPATASLVARALTLFVAWSVVYLLPTDLWTALQLGPTGPLRVIYWRLTQAWANPWYVVFEGTRVHLWFLVSLACCAAVSAAFLRFGAARWLLLLAVVLYAVGLLCKSYSDTAWGWQVAGFNFRNGPFFGLVFFATGIQLQRLQPRASWLLPGLAMALAGAGLQFVELAVLHSRYGTSMEQDYVLGTYFYGTGMAVVALSGLRSLSLPAGLRTVGPLTLGIYAVHYAFVDALRPVGAWLEGQWAWELLQVPLVFVLSLGAAWLLSRWTWTRRFVR